MRFTQAHKDYFSAVRAEDAAVDQLFKNMRQLMEAFPKSKIVYLKLPDLELGVPVPDGIPYIPKAWDKNPVNKKNNAKPKFKN